MTMVYNLILVGSILAKEEPLLLLSTPYCFVYFNLFPHKAATDKLVSLLSVFHSPQSEKPSGLGAAGASLSASGRDV